MASDRVVFKSELCSAELKGLVSQRLKEFSSKEREFLYRETNDDNLWLGIEKGDHAGWWYIARLNNCPEGCLIDGEIVYDPDHISERGSKKESVPGKICTWIFMAIAYVIIFIPAMIAGIIYWIYEKVKGVKTKEEYLDIFMRDYLNCTKLETE